MDGKMERNFGEQPIAKILTERCLKTNDLVSASAEQLTHKMVTRAVKGRQLTPPAQRKVMRALNRATGENYSLSDLFNYS